MDDGDERELGDEEGPMMLVTGATGFVGREVVATTIRRGGAVRAAVRRRPDDPIDGANYVLVPELGMQGEWAAALTGVETLVHAAARVHVMRETGPAPLAEYRRVNVAGTTQLARDAASAGVRRFVFISSIKVNGERTLEGSPFRASDLPAPVDAYGISKQEAEASLRNVSRETGMEVVVIRPPLVYGPGVKANMRSMMRWLSRGIPLPLGAIHNRRSLVGLGNLVDLVLLCTVHPAAAGQTFLVSDGEDVSTSTLLRRMAAALQIAPRLIPVPMPLLKAAALAMGRADLGRRLFESLQLDIAPTRSILGWAPPVSLDEGLRLTASDFRRRRGAE